MVELAMSLRGSNGDTISLQGPDYYLEQGYMGVGLLPVTLRTQPSAGDGSVWRGSRRQSRKLDMPISVLGNGRQDIENKLRRLQRLLSDRVAPPTLRAVYGDGEVYELSVHYTNGAETMYGDQGNFKRARWVLSMVAPSPYWVGDSPVQFLARQDDQEKGLLPELSKLQLSASDVLGEVTVTNTGDVNAFPNFVVTGPATEFSISLGDDEFVYQEEILAEESIAISAEDGTVVGQDGSNKYGNLAPAPRFFTIPTGTSTVVMQATGATPGTLIQGFFLPRREVIF